MKIKNWLKSFLAGAAMGVASAIPGVSGGTIAVIVGIYQKLIDAINNLFKKFVSSFLTLLPIGLGVICAMVPCLLLFDLALEGFVFGIVSLFAGFIIGSFPDIVKEVSDEKPTKKDSIATFDLWHWERERLLTLGEDSIIPIDSLHFSITDSNYFYKSESLQLYLKMRVYASDTVLFTTRVIYHYSDSLVDTLQYESLADSICRRYRFTQIIPSSRNIDSLFIEFVDSIRTIESVEIDSVELNRVYNKFLYPMNSDIRSKIRQANDSIESKKLKVES